MSWYARFISLVFSRAVERRICQYCRQDTSYDDHDSYCAAWQGEHE